MAAPTREGSWVGVFMTGIITFITIIDFNRAIIFKLCCYECAAIMRYHFSIRKWVKYRLPGFLLSVSYFLLRRSEQRLGTQSVPLLHFFHILTVKPMIYWLLPVVNERTNTSSGFWRSNQENWNAMGGWGEVIGDIVTWCCNGPTNQDLVGHY